MKVSWRFGKRKLTNPLNLLQTTYQFTRPHPHKHLHTKQFQVPTQKRLNIRFQA